MSFFQYQRLAQPIPPTITVTADKWYAPPPPRPLTRARSIALSVACMVGPVALPPAVTVDQWKPHDSPRVLARTAPRHAGLSVVEPFPLRAVAAADWQGYENDRPLKVNPRPQGITLADPQPLRTVTAGDWQGHENVRPLTTPPRPQGYVVLEPPALRTVAPADWQGVASQPIRASRLIQSDWDVLAPYVVAAPVETVTVDKWFQPVSQPVRQRALTPPTQYVAPLTTRTATVADWFMSVVQPQRRPRALSSFGAGAQFVPVVASGVIPAQYYYRLMLA